MFSVHSKIGLISPQTPRHKLNPPANQSTSQQREGGREPKRETQGWREIERGKGGGKKTERIKEEVHVTNTGQRIREER